MTIKQFLKPDWRKILIFVVLVILTYFFGIIEYYPWEMAVAGGVTLKTNIFLLPFSFNLKCSRAVIPTPPPWQCSGNVILENDWSIKPDFTFFLSNYPLQISINIVYWYFLSCLIVWIYDKVKKKK